MKKIKINMYSKAESVKGQGVGSAYKEQVALVKEIPEFEISINGKHKNSYDIRHFHTVNPRFFPKIKKNRINICYVHFIPAYDDGSLHMPKPIFKIYKKYVLKFYDKNDELVVVNPYFINELKKVGIDEKKVTYIPNYVSKENFFRMKREEINNIKEKYNIPKDKFIVLGVGQTQTRKGVLDFVEVAKENKDMFFVWAGGFSFGPMTAGYEEIKKAIDNPPKNCKFLGIIDREEMNGIYNIADVMFLPSYQELFPMTILECVNLHTPMLLRNLDLYDDILLHNYVSGTNNEEFSNLLKQYKTDKEFFKKGQEISKNISDYYSKENITKLWKDYYIKIYNKYPNKHAK